MTAKRRHCFGEKGRHKLTLEIAQKIRSEYRRPSHCVSNAKELAKNYGVKPHTKGGGGLQAVVRRLQLPSEATMSASTDKNYGRPPTRSGALHSGRNRAAGFGGLPPFNANSQRGA